MDSITYKLGGVEREFRLLSSQALAELSTQTPSPNGEVIDINGLNKWSKHPTGCVEFLFKSASRHNPKLTREEVAAWGSILSRTNAANDLFIKSIVNGEEDPAPKANAGETGG